ncbi:MAG: hypothetical protein KDE51_07260 [Anaerolineales bacterium]|nr:hypothetical protein [Anaerolineales bacterium]
MRKLLFLAAVFATLALTACGGTAEPQTITEEVEVTRLVEVEREVEVTREVEVEVVVTPTATPLPETSAGSLAEPYTYGETAFLTSNDELSFSLTVTDVVRGPEALQIIKSANQFNEDPPEDFEFVVARLAVEYTGDDAGQLELTKRDVSVVTNGRIIAYSDTFTYAPCCLEPEFEITLLPGGRAEGLIALPVAVDDPNPLLLLGESLYFSLTPSE